MSGTTTLGTAKTTGGVATLSASFANSGTYTLTATYLGDTNFNASTSASLLEVIATPDYTVTVQPPTLTIVQGQTGTATFTVTSVGGYSQPVSFSCSGLPANTTCTFTPSTVIPTSAGATTVLTIQTDVNQAALSFPGPTDPMDRKSDQARIAMQAGGSIFASVLMLLGFSRRRRVLKQLRQWTIWSALLLAALLAGGIGIVSCGGNSHKTPLGQATVMITATGGGQSPADIHVVSLQVNISQ